MHPRCFKLVQIWIVSAGLLTLSLRAESTVEQWGVYEGAFPGPTNGNPFTNVLFSVWFHHQDTSIEIRGFYDGNGVYRARFMPEIQGSWHYVTRSSARELNAITGEFTVTAPSRYNHGPVRVAHTYHFAYADGTPYEELGTTCYNWIHQNEALQEETLQTLAAAPFNKVRMCVFPGDWDTNGQVFYPYEVALPDRPDFSRFNPRFFQHLETRIRGFFAVFSGIDDLSCCRINEQRGGLGAKARAPLRAKACDKVCKLDLVPGCLRKNKGVVSGHDA